ncbi:dihydrofolate reductase [Spiroplasma sabaudiense Ar-1343]|uniref:Dihydrofolate reductase n=1 Tax=Spiroplasma sabaudiense Ar-1343 TaxID=1276257 RepID=W6AAW1_9MOLU|nr:dihydrofolate reductase [Spiroplasma sabaudiense]AHI53990.1 dihydrofolate reductase [Spiroplasma sabaudiense Ar-1343]
MIKLIWAQTKSGIIGKDNKLPWKISQEMAFFKAMTINKAILMGRKTFEAIGSKALPDRQNFVLSSQNTSNSDNLEWIKDVNELIQKYKNNNKEDLMVIGGSQVYKLLFPFADELIVSIIKKDYDGDTKFPDLSFSDFRVYSEEEYDDFIVKKYERIF